MTGSPSLFFFFNFSLLKSYMAHLLVMRTDTVLLRLGLQRQEISLICQVAQKSDIRQVPKKIQQVYEKYKTKDYEPCLDYFFFFPRCNSVKINSSFVQGKLIELGSSHLNQCHLQSLLWSGSTSEYSAINHIYYPNSRCKNLAVKFCCVLSSIGSHVFTSISQNSFLHLAALMDLQEKLLLKSKTSKL